MFTFGYNERGIFVTLLWSIWSFASALADMMSGETLNLRKASRRNSVGKSLTEKRCYQTFSYRNTLWLCWQRWLAESYFKSTGVFSCLDSLGKMSKDGRVFRHGRWVFCFFLSIACCIISIPFKGFVAKCTNIKFPNRFGLIVSRRNSRQKTSGFNSKYANIWTLKCNVYVEGRKGRRDLPL